MSEMYIAKEKFPATVKQLMGRCRVYGPVFRGQYHEFAELKAAEDADMGYQNTRLSPKELFHPQSERMFTYSLDKSDSEAEILKEAPKDFSSRVILGIRPCDAKAFQLDDRNFDVDRFRDPWWVKRRESTTLVGLACNQPCASCFCTTVGTGPFDTGGLDVLLTDVGNGYVARSTSSKGDDLLQGMEGGEKVSSEAAQKVMDLKIKAEKQLGVQFDVSTLSEQQMLELFNASFWDDIQFSCINCGICTFLCPTCWCFDIQDEVHGNKGDRIRNWDSCMFPLFTLHGSGHNPRSQKLQRVRQRFMHKLKYYVDKYKDGVACVGCGRCVRFCPVNIDIRQVARLMSARCVCPA
ncbi:4Fe-4S dicluster domain-containing protein [Desulforhabdus sp. TSK]|uniref:4Fe-4S dicluster domain-containing protein n=1 Tax=Desulforhabdus sp. TSK TaxID=2925014 RepID=UPI001FC83E42|nr:4Fe-4S dicluster domain-containing protein [Desulforhabdus sp. TSK]GKT06916.1 hydrogenase [Desulforhabdus sp. TSK]